MALRDWEAVRAASDIQFAPVPPARPPETPEWLKRLGEWLRDALEPLGQALGQTLGMNWQAVQYVLIALTAALVLFIVWRLVQPLLGWRRQSAAPVDPGWAPARDAAAALLGNADRLAAEGRFAEAVHLLLRRSVQHIASARPDWLIPASTAREIAANPLLPAPARTAFGVIAARVERSLFAMRALDADDWLAARTAYADFALQNLGSGGAA